MSLGQKANRSDLCLFAWQLVKAQETAIKNGWTKFISMQNHLNLIYREEEREIGNREVRRRTGEREN